MSKYNEIMERLTVSDQTKEKLIAGIGRKDRNKSRIIRMSMIRKIATVAACFVLLIVGVIVVKNLNANDEPHRKSFNFKIRCFNASTVARSPLLARYSSSCNTNHIAQFGMYCPPRTSDG